MSVGIEWADHELIECPCCGGPLNGSDVYELGRLGKRIHYRCRYCGGTFSFDTETRQPEKDSS